MSPQQPDALFEVRLREEKATLSLDLSGRSLTRRAYLGDEAGEEAPSVVSQAATLLAAVGAAELFAEGTTFLDPVDGGSILAREAAEVREDRAPGLLRERWGFTGWTAFPDKAWGDLLDEADERCEARMALLATAPACPDAPRLVTSVASVFRADDDAEAVAARAACVAASREAPAGSRFAFAGFEGMAAKFKEEPTVRSSWAGRSERRSRCSIGRPAPLGYFCGQPRRWRRHSRRGERPGGGPVRESFAQGGPRAAQMGGARGGGLLSSLRCRCA
ncbi:MAG: hypothetical protein ACLUE1_05295 [Adlercreutzia equolifaciens]